MKYQIAQAFQERLAPLTKRIENLEQRYSIEGVEAIAERCAEEEDIMRQLHSLMALAARAGSVFSRKVQKKLQSLEARLALLPSAPRIEVIQLAQSIPRVAQRDARKKEANNSEERVLKRAKMSLLKRE